MGRTGKGDNRPGGLIVVDKPAGITSHDVVARVRRLAHTRKVGHGGTLDPMATGVLVVAVGRATRLLTFITGVDKEYRATIRLGQATVTDDAEGDLVSAASAAAVESAQVRAGLAKLTGDIDQVPSAVSAVKVAGQRAYAKVRAGEAVTLAARRIRVSRLDLLGCKRPTVDLFDCDVDVECSSGTYVRAIARDLGADLGVGGHLTALRRTRVGGFELSEALTLSDLAERDDPVTLPLSAAASRLFPRRELDAAAAHRLSHGNPLVAAGIAGPYAAFTDAGDVIAIVRETDGKARPEVVLAPAAG